jgi:uncharacterized protein (TIGR02594 family)
MRIKSKTMMALGCVSLLAMSVPALAEPRPRDDRAPRLFRPAVHQTNSPLFGGPVLVSEARKYMGTNPTDRKRLWCATFMNMVLAKVGYSGTNSDAAKSFAQYGRRISEPKVGAIAVLTRGKKGGHVGVVSGIDANGNPIIISGNHNKRVGEATYARSRVIAYVMPTESRNTQVAGNAARPSQDDGLDSPIAELLAAIEAETSAPARLPPGAQANARQVPERGASRRHIELDPVIAEFLGIKPGDRPAPRVAPPQAAPQQLAPRQVQPQQVAPQRELRVEQVPAGRVASLLR